MILPSITARRVFCCAYGNLIGHGNPGLGFPAAGVQVALLRQVGKDVLPRLWHRYHVKTLFVRLYNVFTPRN